MKRIQIKGFSTLTQLHSRWVQFEVPKTFYHYFLMVLKNKQKQQRTSLIDKEISSLRSGQHLYLKINSAICTRQNSLSIIIQNLPFFKDQLHLLNPLSDFPYQMEILGYKKQFQTMQDIKQRTKNKSLRQLADNLVVYRNITLEIIFLIHKWMAQTKSLGYKGIIQFLHNNQDYLRQINQKTLIIIGQYSQIFQFNPLFVLKKQPEGNQNYFVYDFLKVTPDQQRNINQALKLLSEHYKNLLKFKMLNKNMSNQNIIKIRRALSVDRMYGNLPNGNQYRMRKDPQLKSDWLFYIKNQKFSAMKHIKNDSQVELNFKGLKQPPILKKNEGVTVTNFFQRKQPKLSPDSKQSETAKRKTKEKFTDCLLQRKYSNNILGTYERKGPTLKTPAIIKGSEAIKGEISNVNKLRMSIQMNQTMRFIHNKSNSKQEAEQNHSKIIKNSEIMTQSKQFLAQFRQRKQSRINIQLSLSKSYQTSNQNQLKVQFKVQENIQPANLIGYLRQIFKHQMQSLRQVDKMTSEKMQALSKIILSQRQYISIYKVLSSEQTQKKMSERIKNIKSQDLIAWVVFKLYKDPSNLQKTADVVFSYQQQKGINLKSQIINYFKGLGYCNFKENGKFFHQLDSNSSMLKGTQVIRCKYKVSPSASPEDIKQVIRANSSLKMSRILKFHYYSKTSKYHKFCDHRAKQGPCRIGYCFENVQKIHINNKPYVKVKIDKVSCIEQCYKVYHHLNDKTFLIAAKTLEDLRKIDKYLQKQEEYQMQIDSSFDDGKRNPEKQYEYVCFQQTRIMRKFVFQREKSIINEFVWIQSKLSQVRSIAAHQKDLAEADCLVISKPYVLAIYGKDEQDQLKSLSVLDFSQ